MRHWTVIACLLLSCAAVKTVDAQTTAGAGLPPAAPETIGLKAEQMNRIDAAVAASIQAGDTPGAVVLVARHGKIGYLKAFGNRALQPQRETMTTDTIFDMASLTKVVATTPSVMVLIQNGLVRAGDRVRRYLPSFRGGGKDEITVKELLTHFSGLPPDFDLSKPWEGHNAAFEELYRLATQSQPGKNFVYSDLNFITLAEIVRVVSGKPIEVFAQKEIFEPLGMTETTFNPPKSWVPRIAPTESRDSSLRYLKGSAPFSTQPLRGDVHDPTAWRMGGVAGHAGLFSSARDLAIYCQMLLDQGSFRGKSILAPAAVQAMTSNQSPAGSTSLRGFGWDIDTGYSAPRGDLFAGGYGHTGFTGTSIWIHPPTGTFIIILTNRVHPDGKGDVTHLRAVIANIVAASITDQH